MGEEFLMQTGKHRLLFSSLELDRDDADGAMCFLPESSSLTLDSEEYMTLTATSAGQLPCEECLEADSETIPLPRFCSSGALLKPSLPEGSPGSESDWEDLDEPVDGDEVLRWVSRSTCDEASQGSLGLERWSPWVSSGHHVS